MWTPRDLDRWAERHRFLPRPSGRPPRSAWFYNTMLALLGMGFVLWAFSPPGFGFLALGAAVLTLSAAGSWWCFLLARAVWRRSWSRWIPVAPAGALLTMALVAVDAPFAARWTVSRIAFEAQLEDLPAEPSTYDDWIELDVPPLLGLYRITSGWRVRGGVIFYEANGSLFDDAGFAYLPEGPDPALGNGAFESPQFRHIDGSWYTWTASW